MSTRVLWWISMSNPKRENRKSRFCHNDVHFNAFLHFWQKWKFFQTRDFWFLPIRGYTLSHVKNLVFQKEGSFFTFGHFGRFWKRCQKPNHGYRWVKWSLAIDVNGCVINNGLPGPKTRVIFGTFWTRFWVVFRPFCVLTGFLGS